jgi:hypothetical protein
MKTAEQEAHSSKTLAVNLGSSGIWSPSSMMRSQIGLCLGAFSFGLVTGVLRAVGAV